MVGFKVGCIWYEIGAASFLHSFFSTVAYNLECGNWGTRFPVIMNELYQGKLANANVPNAKVELNTIENELKNLSPDNGSLAPQSNGGLRRKEIRSKIRKCNGGNAARYVGGGRTETKQSEQRYGDGVSRHSQPYQAISHRQQKTEKRDRRPFAGVHRFSQLRRGKSRRYDCKAAQ